MSMIFGDMKDVTILQPATIWDVKSAMEEEEGTTCIRYHPNKCYGCNDRPIYQCPECGDFHCLNHTVFIESEREDQDLCDWSWSVLYEK